MEYLDPKKQRQHAIILYIGYFLIGIAVTIITIVLLYQAYGFGLDRKGTVIQNGLVFFSSQPRPADIYINDKLEKSQTNTRLVLPEATYNVALQRDGYKKWERKIEIMGSKVVYYDYPFLVPQKLSSKNIGTAYKATPNLMTQSSDRRWLIVAQPGSIGAFDVYDLKNFLKTPETIVMPANILTAAETTSGHSLEVAEWADDNRHVLLRHTFQDKIEYILLDRQNVDQSVNLSTVLATSASKITLLGRQFDQYYVLDTSAHTLSRASLSSPVLSTVLTGVLDYKTYGSTVVLYATDIGSDPGKIRIRLQTADRGYSIRTVAASTNYLLDITKYNGSFYLAAGGSSENKVYVYKDPAGQIGADFFRSATPLQVLHVTDPNYISFSSNSQYVMVEHGAQFGVYDIENKRGYNYTAKQPLIPPVTHATWMDGNHLSYISDTKHVIFDFDYQNQRTLGTAKAGYNPVFAPDYKYSYTLTASPTQFNLSQTALRIPSDL